MFLGLHGPIIVLSGGSCKIALFWVGIGSNLRHSKAHVCHVAFFIFVVSANIALKKGSPSDFERWVSGRDWLGVQYLPC